MGVHFAEIDIDRLWLVNTDVDASFYYSKIEESVDFTIHIYTYIVANHGTRIRSHNKYKYIHHIPICIANVIVVVIAASIDTIRTLNERKNYV